MNKSLVFLAFFILSGLVGKSQSKDEIVKLNTLVSKVIIHDCYLTELSGKNSILLNNQEITVKINFDNNTLRSFFTPEVAVQYIYDAALSSILRAIWLDNNNLYHKYNQIKFIVDIRPHDIPPVLVFIVDYQNWKKYKNTGNKVSFIKV